MGFGINGGSELEQEIADRSAFARRETSHNHERVFRNFQKARKTGNDFRLFARNRWSMSGFRWLFKTGIEMQRASERRRKHGLLRAFEIDGFRAVPPKDPDMFGGLRCSGPAKSARTIRREQNERQARIMRLHCRGKKLRHCGA